MAGHAAAQQLALPVTLQHSAARAAARAARARMKAAARALPEQRHGPEVFPVTKTFSGKHAPAEAGLRTGFCPKLRSIDMRSAFMTLI